MPLPLYGLSASMTLYGTLTIYMCLFAGYINIALYRVSIVLLWCREMCCPMSEQNGEKKYVTASTA